METSDSSPASNAEKNVLFLLPIIGAQNTNTTQGNDISMLS